jgi:hypothetical protein
MEGARMQGPGGAHGTTWAVKRQRRRSGAPFEGQNTLDSREPCAPVVSVKSSFIPDWSTVGDEAAFMILGFRKGWYPPDLHSGGIGPDVKDEIRSWWASRKP